MVFRHTHQGTLPELNGHLRFKTYCCVATNVE